MKSYVIFGTGSVAKKVLKMIVQYQDLRVAYFLDNFPKSDYFEGIEVVKGDTFLQREDKCEYLYYVASVYRSEITEQLLNGGIPSESIINAIDIFLDNIDIVDSQMSYQESIVKQNSVNGQSYIFDLSSGFVLGGVEKWSYNLAAAFKDREKKVWLLSNACEEQPPDSLKENAIKSNVDNFYDYQISSIKQLVTEIEKLLPSTIYVAHVSDLLMACVLLKKKYGDLIKVVSVIHGGLQYLVTENQRVLAHVDYVFPVSFDVYNALCDCAGAYLSKVIFKETPINILNVRSRKYTIDNHQPIRVAYAARLEKVHKHSELLIPLMEELEKKHINYQLDVAGDGTLFDKIQQYVNDNSLDDKVNMLGQIDYNKMEDFWLSHDIAINLSECEGCSMAMLESMSAGAVPIFTDVSSTRHFIKHGKNGFVVEYRDVESMAGYIEYLSNNRELLQQFGNSAHKVIEDKCQLEDYVDFLIKK